MEIRNIIIFFLLMHFILSDDNENENKYDIKTEEYISTWRDYPACRLGRLQSPIEINEYSSIYSNDFSFVYQDYKKINENNKISINITNNKTYALTAGSLNGGYVNFERKGVIKQYELIGIELYPALHKINNDTFSYELHLVHKKNLDFMTNKNQYRRIQDPNMYLTIVLRYANDSICSSNKIVCTSDNNLLKMLTNSTGIDSLSDYPIFQDKRAFFYEGSSLHIPCDENVNYYVVKDLFLFNDEDLSDKLTFTKLEPFEKYSRPVYKNFMNYREVLKSNFISFELIKFLLIIFILF